MPGQAPGFLLGANMQITLTDYLGQYYSHPDLTTERAANAAALVEMVNQLLSRAAADGVTLPLNPSTGTHISGQKYGGFRPQDCPIGAPKSTHKQGHGVDLYDPNRDLARWAYNHQSEFQELDLCIEDARWTGRPDAGGWLHIQDVHPGAYGSSWRFCYIPDTSKPTDPTFKA